MTKTQCQLSTHITLQKLKKKNSYQMASSFVSVNNDNYAVTLTSTRCQCCCASNDVSFILFIYIGHTSKLNRCLLIELSFVSPDACNYVMTYWCQKLCYDTDGIMLVTSCQSSTYITHLNWVKGYWLKGSFVSADIGNYAVSMMLEKWQDIDTLLPAKTATSIPSHLHKSHIKIG